MLETAPNTVDVGFRSGDADAAQQANLHRLSDPDIFDNVVEDDEMEGGDLVLDADFANPCVRERGVGKRQVKPKRPVGNVLQPSAKRSASARNAAARQTRQAAQVRIAVRIASSRWRVLHHSRACICSLRVTLCTRAGLAASTPTPNN